MPSKFDPVNLIKQFNRKNIRYILIGRQAVVQYGAPLFSFDYDFWIHPDDREPTFETIEDFGLETNPENRSGTGVRRPIIIFDDDEGNKVDLFFAKILAASRRDIKVAFDKTYKNSILKKDPDSDFYVRIPAIDDLILLKQLGDLAAKDREDIEYLKNIKSS